MAISLLAGKPAPISGIDEPTGDLKVTTAIGWFAARPPATEDVYKIYAESFRNRANSIPSWKKGVADRGRGDLMTLDPTRWPPMAS